MARHACAARVTVLCLSSSVSVGLFSHYRQRSGIRAIPKLQCNKCSKNKWHFAETTAFENEKLSVTTLRGPAQSVVCACVYMSSVHVNMRTRQLESSPPRLANPEALHYSTLWRVTDKCVVQRCYTALFTAASSLRETGSVDRYTGPWPSRCINAAPPHMSPRVCTIVLSFFKYVYA